MATAVREAVGPGYPLMFDAFMGWDATYAEDMLRGSGAGRAHWVEEPVPPERLDVFRRLARTTSIRLATGEHAATRWQVKELLDAGVRVIQADPDWAAGSPSSDISARSARRTTSPSSRTDTRSRCRCTSRRRRPAGRADDRVPGADPGAEPVLPPDDLPSGRAERSSCRRGRGSGSSSIMRRSTDRREARLRATEEGREARWSSEGSAASAT